MATDLSHHTLAKGVWVYWLNGVPTSVNARAADPTPSPEWIESQIAIRFGVRVILTRALGANDEHDPVYCCEVLPDSNE
jgi:hypothetical protein